MYIFYKNMVLIFTVFFYNFYSAVSGQKFYLEVSLQAFNVVWTLVPIVVMSIFDKDVDDSTARALPQIYHLGVRSVYYNRWVVARWFGDAVLEGLCILLMLVWCLPSVDPPDGSDPSVFYLGAHAFTLVLLVVTAKLLLWQWQVTWYMYTCLAFFFLIWWPCAMLASKEFWIGSYMYTFTYGWTGMWQNVTDHPSFWLLLLLVPATALLPQLFYLSWKRAFYPEFRDLAIEAEVLKLDMKHLAATPIPMAHRRLPLRKNAPRA